MPQVDHPASIAPAAGDCSVVELRQYTLRHGQRDTLIGLFEREFVEAQEAVGMRVIGHFRDLDDPDRFVWLRGFADMASRQRALEAFYDGPVWTAHRDAANATMIDSDNVLLLRPASPQTMKCLPRSGRAPPGSTRIPPGQVNIAILHLRDLADAGFLAVCRRRVARALTERGAMALAWYITEPASNTYPRLPVREGEPVLVGLALFAEPAAGEAIRSDWTREVEALLPRRLARAPELLRLQPAPRSAVHANILPENRHVDLER